MPKHKRSTKGENRDEKGRFTKGCAPGPGNPHVQKVAAWRSALASAVTPEDITFVVKSLVRQARLGDLTAIGQLLDRTLGRPTQGLEVETDGGVFVPSGYLRYLDHVAQENET